MNDDQKNYMTDRLNHFTLELSEHLAQTVEGAVKVAVNGKIDSMRASLEIYKKDDAVWKDRVEPMVRAYESATWITKGITAFIVFLATLAAVSEFVIKFILRR